MNAHMKPGHTGAWWWFGELATPKVRSDQTEGALSILEILAPAGLAVPRHVHHREDEIFVILEGSATFNVGDKTIEAGPGDTLFGPRGVPHDYVVGTKGCRMLFAFTPGSNMEGFVAGSAVPACSATLPPADVVPPSPDVLSPLLERHGLAFV